jgi:hypothetical protein
MFVYVLLVVLFALIFYDINTKSTFASTTASPCPLLTKKGKCLKNTFLNKVMNFLRLGDFYNFGTEAEVTQLPAINTTLTPSDAPFFTTLPPTTTPSPNTTTPSPSNSPSPSSEAL